MVRRIRVGVGARIISIVLVATVASAALAYTMYTLSMKSTYQMRENHLRDVVDTTMSVLNTLQNEVEMGVLSLEEAQEQARLLIAEIKYDGNNYFFAFDHDAVIVAHGSKPELIGTNQLGFEDPNGVKVYQELVRAAENGGGLVHYNFFRYHESGNAEMTPKISFVRDFAPWGWVVGTGSYIEDIQRDLAAQRSKGLIAFAIGVFSVTLASFLIGRSVTGPINRLNKRMHALSSGDLDSEIPFTKGANEISQMAQSIEVFRDGIREKNRMREEDALRKKRDLETAAQVAEEERQREAQQIERDQAAEAEQRERINRDEAEKDALRRKTEEERDAHAAEQQKVVTALAAGLRGLAAGDLSIRIADEFVGPYETLRLDFNEAVGTLAELIGHISETSQHIVEQGETITHSAEDVAKRTEQNAATLEETAAALEELTSSVNLAAKGAADADRIVIDARGTAEQSGQVVRQAVEAMGAIEQSSGKISKIIHVIDDIAFQTNLLALNAGVEAARAGEAGRGFAVVASEVRALAQRSSEAASEINSLISESGSHVNNGVALVGEAGQTLERIAASVSDIATHVSDIAKSANEQSVGLSEINTSVSNLDHTTQATTALFQDTLIASRTLTGEATNLGQSVSQFSLGEIEQAKVATLSPATHAQRPTDPARPSPPPVQQVVNAPASSLSDESGWEDF